MSTKSPADSPTVADSLDISKLLGKMVALLHSCQGHPTVCVDAADVYDVSKITDLFMPLLNSMIYGVPAF
jgi:hypothetical protein